MVKKLPFLILLILLAGKNYAQQDYFVLIQADDNQPFFALLGDKTFSSSAKGHLILSQLKEGACTIIIGFPKKGYPDQQFSIDIDKKDLEFQLKNLGDKGWNLFNLQTLELKPANKKEEATVTHNEGIKKDDAFSRLMAGVVSDTAVMYNTYSMEQVLKDSPAVSVARPDSIAMVVDTSALSRRTLSADSAKYGVLRDTTSNSAISVNSPVSNNTAITINKTPDTISTDLTPVDTSYVHPRKTGMVAKLSERKTIRGLRLVYTDKQKGVKTDTIVVIIPTTDTAAATTKVTRAKVDSPTVAGQLYRSNPSGGNTKESNPSSISAVTSPANTGKLMVVNTDCKNFATGYDVDKLRVKMLEIGKDDDRILAAKKVFKSKCFTTNQIKALSEVFTTDAVKYRFFETAYPFVSDDHFRELSGLLADPVYNGKFRAMTGQQ